MRISPGLLILLIVSSGCRPGGRASEPVARRLNAMQVADRAKPATVQVVVRFEMTIEAPDLKFDEAAFLQAALPRAGGLDSEARMNALLGAFAENPGRFLSAQSTRTGRKSITSTGTGLVITPDGYVVTNAHVVSPDESMLKEKIVETVSDSVDRHVKRFAVMADQAVRGQLSSAARRRLAQVFAQQHANASRIRGLQSRIGVFMGYTRDGAKVDIKGIPCELKKPMGEPYPGKDVAILKMDGDDYPTVPLAAGIAAAGIRAGADMHIIGYPGDVMLHEIFTLPSRLEPSLSSGHVSGIKEVTAQPRNWPVIQTDAAINHGNSGGPALNDRAEVAGLATFLLSGQDGARPQGLNFVVAVDVVHEFLRELGITPRQSTFTRKYIEALEAMESHDRARARMLFRDLAGRHPELVMVREFLKQLDGGAPIVAAESRKQDPVLPSKPRSQGRPFLFFGAFAAVLILLVVIVVLKNR